MPDMLLTTKLHLPPMRANSVARLRLTAKLNRALEGKLAMIVAPPGFGKTTLLREWIEAGGQPVGWLSLDGGDNAPGRFLLYLIHALRAIAPSIGESALKLLNSTHQPQIETVLTHLVNDLTALSGDHLLVLDDYHLIVDQTIHDALDFLIAHGPPNLHLLIASRTQPPLSLARLRGQGELLELGSADLRFTAVEAEAFLRDAMQLNLAAADRLALEMRTEGWIAGLQLAGLSLQTQADQTAFISAFTGTDRYVGDYLFEEVLRHQPDEVRDFLLYTSILDLLRGDLCDALLGQSGGQAMLERLDSLQLFIVPLDNQRHWYRYHHLFRDLLRHQLKRTGPAQIPALHQHASQWFEQNDHLEDAIRHGLEADDFDRAAELIETAFQRKDWVHRDMHRLVNWFDALPENVVQSRPKLLLAHAWLLLEIYADQWEQIEDDLQGVENFLNNGDYPVAEANPLLAQVDLLRANHARHANQPEQVIQLCQRALQRLPADESYIRSGVMAHLAAAYESLGDLEAASRTYADSLRMCRAADNVDGLLFAAARLIEVLIIQGQLREAKRIFDGLQPYQEQRTGPDMGMIDIGMGEVYRQQNQLERARSLLERGVELCRPFEAWRDAVTTGWLRLARVLAAASQYDEAMNLLQSVERQSAQTDTHLESTRIELLLLQGDFSAAARLAGRIDLSTNHTGIRLLIAQATLESQGIYTLNLASDPLNEAENRLQPIEQVAQAGSRAGQILEIHLLQAQIHVLHGQTTKALQRLESALLIAEPESHIRVFVDQGLPIYQLLTLYATRPASTVSPDFVDAIRAALPSDVQQTDLAAFPRGSALTDSELRTLRLLASERSVKDIADELSISISTVRTYAKRIYSKLDAHSRAEAVYLARELNLL